MALADLDHGVIRLTIERPDDEDGPVSPSSSWLLPDDPTIRHFEQRRSLTEPVDEFLALVDEPDWNRIGGLSHEYGLFGLLPAQNHNSKRPLAPIKREVERWRRDELPAAFLAAARRARRGIYDGTIAKHLERLRFRGSAVEVNDLPALAAWGLLELVRRGKPEFTIRTCDNCKFPFLASPTGRYCKRVAPQSPVQTCREWAKGRDYRARKRAQKGATNG